MGGGFIKSYVLIKITKSACYPRIKEQRWTSHLSAAVFTIFIIAIREFQDGAHNQRRTSDKKKKKKNYELRLHVPTSRSRKS